MHSLMYALMFQTTIKLWCLYLLLFFIYVGYLNDGFKVWNWGWALTCVAFTDPKTRNNFWHMVINGLILSIGVTMMLVAFKVLHL